MHPILAWDARSMAEADLPRERLAGGTIFVSGAT
jgi:hypothetical protein